MRPLPEAALKACRLLAIPMIAALATWPLLPNFFSAWPALPEGEVSNHLWGLNTPLRELLPLGGPTLLMNFPEGLRWVPVDPLHGPLYALGELLGGPVSGFNLVVLWGFLLAAAAGWMLGREAGAGTGGALIAALVAGISPQLLATVGDGQSENAGLGWVGIQLVLLLRFIRLGGSLRGLAASLALALAWYSGAYNGVFASILDGLLGLALLVLALHRASMRRPGRERPDTSWRGLGRALLVAVLGLLLVTPLARAVLLDRPEGLPGSASRAELPAPEEHRLDYRGGLHHGVDLLDLALPGPLTAPPPPQGHTGYLGVSVLLLAVLGLRRDRAAWPWAVGATLFAALSLGPWLSIAGQVRWLEETSLLAPAGVLSLAFPPLLRISRWYRASAVASMLLGPLVARSLKGRPWPVRILLILMVTLDCLLLAPLSWPLPMSEPPPSDALRSLPQPGALFVLPSSTFGEPPPGGYRDLDPLLQVYHGRPCSGGMLGVEGWTPGTPQIKEMVSLVRGGKARAETLRELRDLGFRYLVIHPGYRDFGAWEGNLSACFGALAAQDPLSAVVDLEDFNTARCTREAPTGPPMDRPASR